MGENQPAIPITPWAHTVQDLPKPPSLRYLCTAGEAGRQAPSQPHQILVGAHPARAGCMPRRQPPPGSRSGGMAMDGRSNTPSVPDLPVPSARHPDPKEQLPSLREHAEGGWSPRRDREGQGRSEPISLGPGPPPTGSSLYLWVRCFRPVSSPCNPLGQVPRQSSTESSAEGLLAGQTTQHTVSRRGVGDQPDSRGLEGCCNVCSSLPVAIRWLSHLLLDSDPEVQKGTRLGSSGLSLVWGCSPGQWNPGHGARQEQPSLAILQPACTVAFHARQSMGPTNLSGILEANLTLVLRPAYEKSQFCRFLSGTVNLRPPRPTRSAPPVAEFGAHRSCAARCPCCRKTKDIPAL